MIEKKAFGRTGHLSTRVLFGAAALGGVSQEEADQVLALLLRYGINHIDTAHSYGKAELLIGPWMPEHRDKFFLATKTEQRTYDGAWAELETSLQLLKTDHIDLWQMHVLITEEGWQTAMGADGALKAFLQAREQGIVRFLGVTGHELVVPRMHLRSLERFDFDAVLLPYNYMLMQDSQYAADFEALLAVCAARNVAVQTIKSLCRRPWASDVAHNRSTWYQPLEIQEAIDKAVHWVLGDERVFLNSVGDIHLLPQVLEAAANFQQRPSNAEMAALVEEQAMSPLFV
ncbi:MAG: aldo/keto reductase [Anaerolineae bacterium]|jgi:aryl-alcohol dehydrogenase-like predicted oxidoreductase|nr:aldo/keto reductase [Anaerolineae bacterium]